MIYSTADLHSKQRELLSLATKAPVYIKRKGMLYILQAVRNEVELTETARAAITQQQLDAIKPLADEF